MKIVVLKFGGTSVGSLERIKKVAKIIKIEIQQEIQYINQLKNIKKVGIEYLEKRNTTLHMVMRV